MPARFRNPLGECLDALLQARGLNSAEFARQVGIKTGTLHAIKVRRPTGLPKKLAIEEWVAKLGLSKNEARELREAAELSYSPEGIQTLVARLRREASRSGRARHR